MTHQKIKKVKIFKLLEPDFNFTNVGGYQSIKEELLQVSEILGNREKYASYNIRMPKGVILEGPPGMEKQLLPKH